ncbi:hypothetical protein TBLA_0A08190 [Henningerozyma blattae CBS 6284]|uniref:HTH La-type RNA-binding domain-containing protein n=1 Tax=Henningerozyma blattae (strain ATCC 34711 / CBS 6284 / DSM 70876 / NBRC 10599 / NRRL Y-10934 / UCD 77-7) TaxID=1071380 RepID=I2GWV7_HENB6|nr:hypothetical protein TBLA_0A08190 [Tetrapisispora blattae CBS 6284]CCH58609.1 hypothetical protein TBLA_0A08190 [Tetrapisispora blattae CBS 6284]
MFEEIAKECLKQIEFYFSEFNYPFDKFLRGVAEKDEGWVPLRVISKFSRMSKYDGEANEAKIIALIKNESQILEVSDDGLKIRRIQPLNIDNLKEEKLKQNKRSLVVSGFKHEDVTKENFNETFDKISGFLQGLKDVEINQLRLQKGKHQQRFNGVVFVEFPSEEDSKKFLEDYGGEEPREEKLAFEGVPLEIVSKKEYYAKHGGKRNAKSKPRVEKANEGEGKDGKQEESK